MALKTVITQKQKLSLTTHMQLSLELLQMDSIALKEKIETELERNPILEENLTPDLSQAETPTIQWSDDIPNHNFSENSYLDIADYPANMPLSLSDYLLEQLENTSISQELFPVVQYLIFNLDSRPPRPRRPARRRSPPALPSLSEYPKPDFLLRFPSPDFPPAERPQPYLHRKS